MLAIVILILVGLGLVWISGYNFRAYKQEGEPAYIAFSVLTALMAVGLLLASAAIFCYIFQ